MGRPPLPPERRRDVVLRFRTTVKARDEFKALARKHGYTTSTAMREAIGDWINKMRSSK